MDEFERFEPVEEEQKSKPRQVEVHVVAVTPEWVIVTDGDTGYLIDPKEAPEGAAFVGQEIFLAKRIVDRAPQAHDFVEEYELLFPTINAVRQMFWSLGIISKEQFNDKQLVRQALRHLLPSAEEFKKNAR